MYIRCYKSTSSIEVRERVWRLIYGRGFISDHITYMLFYIPEDLLSFALLIDSSMKREPKLDYIV